MKKRLLNNQKPIKVFLLAYIVGLALFNTVFPSLSESNLDYSHLISGHSERLGASYMTSSIPKADGENLHSFLNLPFGVSDDSFLSAWELLSVDKNLPNLYKISTYNSYTMRTHSSIKYLGLEFDDFTVYFDNNSVPVVEKMVLNFSLPPIREEFPIAMKNAATAVDFLFQEHVNLHGKPSFSIINTEKGGTFKIPLNSKKAIAIFELSKIFSVANRLECGKINGAFVWDNFSINFILAPSTSEGKINFHMNISYYNKTYDIEDSHQENFMYEPPQEYTIPSKVFLNIPRSINKKSFIKLWSFMSFFSSKTPPLYISSDNDNALINKDGYTHLDFVFDEIVAFFSNDKLSSIELNYISSSISKDDFDSFVDVAETLLKIYKSLIKEQGLAERSYMVGDGKVYAIPMTFKGRIDSQKLAAFLVSISKDDAEDVSHLFLSWEGLSLSCWPIYGSALDKSIQFEIILAFDPETSNYTFFDNKEPLAFDKFTFE